MPWIIDRFGRKRCQKKRKCVDYKLLWEFKRNILLCMNSRRSKIRSVHMCMLWPGRFILIESIWHQITFYESEMWKKVIAPSFLHWNLFFKLFPLIYLICFLQIFDDMLLNGGVQLLEIGNWRQSTKFPDLFISR